MSSTQGIYEFGPFRLEVHELRPLRNGRPVRPRALREDLLGRCRQVKRSLAESIAGERSRRRFLCE